ncbi:hypothetical protein GCK72_009384 [Caenorhabditis remanei]|uniref:Uncharacterized protein n=1 Tax=Caenorhabditis remanei TaxID=31234 RepID=A0A6A5H029_CAERE|nr:hypothetical protein GCK72_009384 [Caenorhabditis remanei]KAF1761130.1 hypothetical protein GCK72_009384 [Caenorhabditis remanei]
MPWLEVDGECSWTLVSSLIDITSSVIVDTKHWYESVRCSVSSSDDRTGGTNLVDIEPDSSSALRDESTLLQSVVDSKNRILAHRQQEARRHLWTACSRVEESWRSMSHVALRHQIVRLDGSSNVLSVDSDRNTHQHLLWPLNDFLVDFEKSYWIYEFHVQAVAEFLNSGGDLVKVNIFHAPVTLDDIGAVMTLHL